MRKTNTTQINTILVLDSFIKVCLIASPLLGSEASATRITNESQMIINNAIMPIKHRKVLGYL